MTSHPEHNRTKKRKSFGQRLECSFWKRARKIQRVIDNPILLRFFGPIQIFVLRNGERLGGVRALSWIIKPFIYWDLALRLMDYPEFIWARTILPPKFWQGLTPSRHYSLMIRNWQSTLAVGLLSDRLRASAWAQRIQIKGIPPHQQSEWGKRPVILAFLHIGGYGILRHWLRAQKLPAATYLTFTAAIYRTPWAKKIQLVANKNNGLLNVPGTFEVGQNLRPLLKFLVPGHVLSVALDGRSASSAIFNANGYPIHLSTGIVELAALSNAILLPVSVRCPSAGRFDIHFGVPVPDEWIDRLNPKRAVQFMLDQLWKHVEEKPESICWGLLYALSENFSAPHKPWP